MPRFAAPAPLTRRPRRRHHHRARVRGHAPRPCRPLATHAPLPLVGVRPPALAATATARGVTHRRLQRRPPRRTRAAHRAPPAACAEGRRGEGGGGEGTARCRGGVNVPPPCPFASQSAGATRTIPVHHAAARSPFAAGQVGRLHLQVQRGRRLGRRIVVRHAHSAARDQPSPNGAVGRRCSRRRRQHHAGTRAVTPAQQVHASKHGSTQQSVQCWCSLSPSRIPPPPPCRSLSSALLANPVPWQPTNRFAATAPTYPHPFSPTPSHHPPIGRRTATM
jgi:hypothetical protein